MLEGAWRENRSGFYKGLILLASALVHAQRVNPRGTASQLRKAITALTPYTPSYLGLDVEAIVRYAREGLRLVAQPSGVAERLGIRPPRLEPREAFLRGTEPELSSALGSS